MEHRPDEQRPGGRERRQAPLPLEAEREKRLDQHRDLVRVRLDPRSTTFLPGSPETALLPTCSVTVPGRADAISRASSRATSIVRGSHGWKAAGRRSYRRIGRSDIVGAV